MDTDPVNSGKHVIMHAVAVVNGVLQRYVCSRFNNTGAIMDGQGVTNNI